MPIAFLDSLTATDWIALMQAVFLLAAAIFAWWAYRLAVTEHREAREEARKAPLRDLVADVVREVKDLADAAAGPRTATGVREGRVAGRQQRLAIALEFVPPNVFGLTATRDLSECNPTEVEKGDRIGKARTELLVLFARIERGEYSILHAAPLSFQPELGGRPERSKRRYFARFRRIKNAA